MSSYIDTPDDEGNYWVDVDDFVARLLKRIHVEDYFRLQQLEIEGKDISSLGPEDTPLCELERRDKPAWRQLVNDGIDAMEKAREWITFDNGDRYYWVSEVKELINEDLDKDTYTDELKGVLSFWL